MITNWRSLRHQYVDPAEHPFRRNKHGPHTVYENFLEKKGIKPIHGRPCYPQTQGKIERYHRTMKNVVKLDNYYAPEELERALEKFVHYYNYERYHESIKNLCPADVYFGKAERILKEREKVKTETIKQRRQIYYESKFFNRLKNYLTLINTTLNKNLFSALWPDYIQTRKHKRGR